MAHALVDAGASICMAQRDKRNLNVADSLRAKGARVKLIHCDLTSMQDAKDLVPKAVEVMEGRIDIVINCGGLLKRKPSVNVTEQEWDSVGDKWLVILLALC